MKTEEEIAREPMTAKDFELSDEWKAIVDSGEAGAAWWITFAEAYANRALLRERQRAERLEQELEKANEKSDKFETDLGELRFLYQNLELALKISRRQVEKLTEERDFQIAENHKDRKYMTEDLARVVGERDSVQKQETKG